MQNVILDSIKLQGKNLWTPSGALPITQSLSRLTLHIPATDTQTLSQQAQERSRQPTSRQPQKCRQLRESWPAELWVQPSCAREQDGSDPGKPVDTSRERRHLQRVTRHLSGCGAEQGPPGEEERRCPEHGRKADCLATVESGRQHV